MAAQQRRRGQMSTGTTSGERLLRALSRETDFVPCCFMSFAALRKRHNEDVYALALAEKALGLDPMLFIPAASRSQRRDHPDLRGLPMRPHPTVVSRVWPEPAPDRPGLLHKEYHTPAGTLTTTVQLSDDWPHGLHIPLVDDYQVPRATKPLVTGPEDLPALQYLLTTPTEEDRLSFQHEAQRAHAFAKQHDVLLAGGWGVAMDLANWLCGMQNLMLLAIDQPEFVRELLQIISAWNLRRMEVVLSAPVDLFIRRAWYEGCDFLSADAFGQLVLPHLRREVDLAHDHGAKFGYICTSGTQPMVDAYLEAGIDALIGVDPVQGRGTDMQVLKARLGDKVCLWGGVSGAITVEMGDENQVRDAVRHALDTLGPRGFILSPVDNITVDAPLTWRNIEVFIDEWRLRR